jgi:hypothetical protein
MRFVLVRLKDIFYHDRDGQLHLNDDVLKWERVRYLKGGTCEHLETICDYCIDSWRNDYDVKV